MVLLPGIRLHLLDPRGNFELRGIHRSRRKPARLHGHLHERPGSVTGILRRRAALAGGFILFLASESAAQQRAERRFIGLLVLLGWRRWLSALRLSLSVNTHLHYFEHWHAVELGTLLG